MVRSDRNVLSLIDIFPKTAFRSLHCIVRTLQFYTVEYSFRDLYWCGYLGHDHTNIVITSNYILVVT